jgi:hypothetical protein
MDLEQEERRESKRKALWRRIHLAILILNFVLVLIWGYLVMFRRPQ